eukprot:UN29982
MGDHCEVPKTPCTAEITCSGNGSLEGEYVEDGCSCDCDDNWESDNCSDKIMCTDEYCNNNGSVSGNLVDGCSCTCDSDFTGDQCVPKTPCTSAVDCSGNGNARQGLFVEDGCECSCEDEWSGSDDCSVPLACDADDCSGNGRTADVDRTDGCDCTCDDNWTGDACELYACSAGTVESNGATVRHSSFDS